MFSRFISAVESWIWEELDGLGGLTRSWEKAVLASFAAFLCVPWNDGGLDSKKGCEFPVASQSRSLPQIMIHRERCTSQIFRAALQCLMAVLCLKVIG